MTVKKDGITQVNTGGGGSGDVSLLDFASPSIGATVFDRTNSNPLAVELVDTNGDPISVGGGTQYVEGSTTTPATGTVALGRNAAGELVPIPITETNSVSVDLGGALPVGTNVIGSVTIKDVGGTEADVTAANALKVDNSAVTQPISAAALPLPALAATSTKQSDGTQTTKIVNGANTAAITAVGSILVASFESGDNFADMDGQLNIIKSYNSDILLNQTNGTQKSGTKIPLTPSSPAAVSVGIASTLILAANASRRGARLVNTSNARISLAFGVPAVLNSGMTLFPGGSFNMDEYDFNTSAINGIASAAASNIGAQELT